MKPGDLVRLADDTGIQAKGRIIDILPTGSAVVRWTNGAVSSVPIEKLEVRS